MDMEDQAKEDKFNCTACNISLASFEDLKAHLEESSHKNQVEPPQDEDKFNCTSCNISLSSWEDLKEHLQSNSHKIQTDVTHEGEEVRLALAEGFLAFQSSNKIKCLLCRIVVEFEDSLQIFNHIQELEHKRLAGIGLNYDDGFEARLEIEDEKSSDDLETKKLVRTGDPSRDTFNCKACNIQTSSFEQLEEHTKGSKHRLRANESPGAEVVRAQLDKGFLRQKSSLKINCLLCRQEVDFIDDIGPIYEHIHDPEHVRLAELGVIPEVEGLSKEELEAKLAEEDAKLAEDDSPEAEKVREAIKRGFLKRNDKGKYFCKPCNAKLDFKGVRPLNEHVSGSKHLDAVYTWKMMKSSRGPGPVRGYFPPPPMPPAMWGPVGRERGGGRPYSGYDGGPGNFSRSPYPPPWVMYSRPPSFRGGRDGPGWGRGRGRGRGRGGRGGRGSKNQSDDNQMPPKKRMRNIEVLA